jgi:SAM-dependent methyltransferase
VHAGGFSAYGRDSAPELLAILEPVRAAGGTVLELGAGSGALTRELVAAGLRVIATDSSPAMLTLLRRSVPGALEARRLVLPDNPLPRVDAIVSVGHVLNYLSSEAHLRRALEACARALRPGGVLALDMLDVRYGEARRDAPPAVRTGDG